MVMSATIPPACALFLHALSGPFPRDEPSKAGHCEDLHWGMLFSLASRRPWRNARSSRMGVGQLVIGRVPGQVVTGSIGMPSVTSETPGSLSQSTRPTRAS